LSPFEQPACTKEGVVFDLVNILEYIKKHKSNPITGEPITSNDIIRLKMFKNAEDKWHCPVTCKVFNNTSHIVAIKTTGNVFSYDAVHELNIKPKIFNDLLTNEPFAKSDIITIQNHLDEEHMKKRDVNTFMHLQQVRKDLLTESQSSTDHHMRSTPMIDKVMNEVKRRRVENEEIEKEKKSREESIETDDGIKVKTTLLRYFTDRFSFLQILVIYDTFLTSIQRLKMLIQDNGQRRVRLLAR
jgi:peptidyl-prolyl cis-trans isomerase-like protein 2